MLFKDLIGQNLGYVAMSLPNDQKVPSSIPGSKVWFFSTGELFHGIHRLGVSYSLPMSCPMFSLEKAFALCWLQVTSGPTVVSVFVYVIHRNVNPLTSG